MRLFKDFEYERIIDLETVEKQAKFFNTDIEKFASANFVELKEDNFLYYFSEHLTNMVYSKTGMTDYKIKIAYKLIELLSELGFIDIFIEIQMTCGWKNILDIVDSHR